MRNQNEEIVMKKSILSLFLLLAFATCDNGDNGAKKLGTFAVNGVIYDIVSSQILYNKDIRYVQFYDASSNMLQYLIAGRGDPSDAANQIPSGTWTDLDASNLYSVFLSLTNDGIHEYNIGVTYDAFSLSINGAPGSQFSIAGTIAFTYPQEETIQINYSGPYDYIAY
jgi:hypothetical protein